MKEFWINDDGIRLHIKIDMPAERKAGPLLILLHGLCGHMEEKHLSIIQQAVTEAGIAVLRADLYGHGKSDGLFQNHTIFKWISNLMTITEYAKSMPEVTDLYLSGHSQGGLLAMIAAGMRPDDYRAVIPLSPGVFLPEAARHGSLLGIPFDPDHIPDRITAEVPGLGTLCFSGNYLRCMRMIHVEESIHSYPGPVLIIHGEKDEMIPVRQSAMAAKLYANCRLAVIADEAHDYDRHLNAVCEEIVSFLLAQETNDRG